MKLQSPSLGPEQKNVEDAGGVDAGTGYVQALVHVAPRTSTLLGLGESVATFTLTSLTGTASMSVKPCTSLED